MRLLFSCCLLLGPAMSLTFFSWVDHRLFVPLLALDQDLNGISKVRIFESSRIQTFICSKEWAIYLQKNKNSTLHLSDRFLTVFRLFLDQFSDRVPIVLALVWCVHVVRNVCWWLCRPAINQKRYIFFLEFNLELELGLKLEWLEGVSKTLGRLVYFVLYLYGGRSPPSIATIQNTQASPEFLTLPQVIPTSIPMPIPI